jgi:hypothetical protein
VEIDTTGIGIDEVLALVVDAVERASVPSRLRCSD